MTNPRLRFSAPFLATLLLTTPAAAQIIPTGTPAADILLATAITEHRTFLTCSALDPVFHAKVLATWQQDTAAAIAILTASNVGQDAINAFAEAADPKTLLPAPDTPWSAVKGLCDTQPDWRQRYSLVGISILELHLPQAFP